MKVSTQIYRLASRFGDTEAVQFLCKLGYDNLDYSFFGSRANGLPIEEDNFLEKMKKLNKLAASYGVTFNQTHAPFGSFIEGDDEYNEWVKPLIIKSIEASGILGAKYVVVHPFVTKDNQKQANLDFFNSLIPYAKKHNVKIAIENMFGWNPDEKKHVQNVCSNGTELCDYLDSLDRKYFVACLDIGHSGLVGEDAAEMILQLGCDRLKCLHVHDNDFNNDQHTMPYCGKLDFDKIIKALKAINYKGELTLEADNFLNSFPEVLLKDASVLMYKTARYLADL